MIGIPGQRRRRLRVMEAVGSITQRRNWPGESIPAQAILYAATPDVLVGEELFATAAYLKAGQAHRSSLVAQDVFRWLLILTLIATGISLHFAGSDAPLIEFSRAVRIHNVAGVLLVFLYIFFVIANAEPSQALYDDLARRGVTATMGSAWAYGDRSAASLGAKVDRIEAFGERFIRS